MEVEEQQVIWEWKELRGYLEAWERHWLNHLEELKRDIVQSSYEQDSKGVESTKNSMEDGVLKIDPAVEELKQRLRRFSWKRSILQEALLRFKEELQLEMNGDIGYRIASSFQSTLPHHPQEDRKETSATEIQVFNFSESTREDKPEIVDADSKFLVFQELAPFKIHSEESWAGFPSLASALPRKVKEEEEEEVGISAGGSLTLSSSPASSIGHVDLLSGISGRQQFGEGIDLH
ncbi:hypothetical protein JD844_013298 [Phrynosoma platyrhinos]|uniref:Uncharacterized protein n=1 Tax=Phrynosoma platyrhinos TaxID=52577 RepID=A0ABQ7TMG9_PHRPL|nr:hypothetical protein JD844_013298 [Phrynosoma platyrhinos]